MVFCMTTDLEILAQFLYLVPTQQRPLRIMARNIKRRLETILEQLFGGFQVLRVSVVDAKCDVSCLIHRF